MVADRQGQADVGEDCGDALLDGTPMITRASATARSKSRRLCAAAPAFAVAQGPEHLTGARRGTSVALEEILDFLNGKLAKYKVPKSVVLSTRCSTTPPASWSTRQPRHSASRGAAASACAVACSRRVAPEQATSGTDADGAAGRRAQDVRLDDGHVPGQRLAISRRTWLPCATLSSPTPGHEERYELSHLWERVLADLLRQQAAELDPVGAATTG
jgi:hypothetical protein